MSLACQQAPSMLPCQSGASPRCRVTLSVTAAGAGLNKWSRSSKTSRRNEQSAEAVYLSPLLNYRLFNTWASTRRPDEGWHKMFGQKRRWIIKVENITHILDSKANKCECNCEILRNKICARVLGALSGFEILWWIPLWVWLHLGSASNTPTWLDSSHCACCWSIKQHDHNVATVQTIISHADFENICIKHPIDLPSVL